MRLNPVHSLFLAVASILYANGSLADSVIKPYPVGAAISGTMQMPYLQVPIPAGPWKVISESESLNNNLHTIGSIYMVQIVDGKFVGFGLVSTNADIPTTRFQNLKGCRRTDMLFVRNMPESSINEGCWWINHLRMAGENASAEYRRVFSYAREQGLRVPLNLIQVGFRIADRSAYVTVWWAFNPELDGIAPPKYDTWASSEFNKVQIENYPKRVRYVEKMERFGAQCARAC